jgi:hypothetical protein
MVELLVELTAPEGRVDDLLQALEAVMRRARLDRRCASASIWCAPEGGRVLRYQEEWVEAAVFEREAQGERIGRLLELLELAEGPPTLKVRSIAGVQGVEYFAAARATTRPGADGPAAGTHPA